MVESAQDPMTCILDEDRLKDPYGDRMVPASELPLPPQRPLSLERGFIEGEKINTALINLYLFQ